MFKRSVTFFLTLSGLAGLAVLMSPTALSQGGIKNYLIVQGSTPGISQSGHSNLSGTMRAGQFVGGGAGLSGLDGASITTGTIASGRLPSNVAYLTGTQSWSANNVFAGPTTFAAAGTPFSVTANGVVTNLNADLLDGFTSADFLQGVPVPLNLSGVNVGGSIVSASNSSVLNNSRGVSGFSVAATGETAGVHGQSTSTSGRGVTATALATTGTTYGVYSTSLSSTGTGVFGNATSASGATIGVSGSVASSSGIGVFGLANAGAGATYGVKGQTQSPSGAGVYGLAIGAGGAGILAESTVGGNSYGIIARKSAINGAALLAETSAANSATAILARNLGPGVTVQAEAQASGRAIMATSNGQNGFGEATLTAHNLYVGANNSSAAIFSSEGIGDTVRINSYRTTGTGTALQVTCNLDDGIGVLSYGKTAFMGIADGTWPAGVGVEGRHLGNGAGYGVFGWSTDGNGTGVFGENTSTAGNAVGGRFESASATGRAILALATGSTGTNFGVHATGSGTGGRGVFGTTTASGVADTPNGVRGSADIGTAGYGVFAAGDLGASGTKAFMIDHPLDPENKYLFHYSSESPFPQNFYNGTVTTDQKGYAWIDLPDYFGEINTNVKYQLTVVDEADSDDFIMAKVTKKVTNNRFQIRTSKPHVEVSWEVKADRNDLRIRYRKPFSELEKPANEKGKFQHPELYNQPKSRGVDFDPNNQPAKRKIVERPSRR